MNRHQTYHSSVSSSHTFSSSFRSSSPQPPSPGRLSLITEERLSVLAAANASLLRLSVDSDSGCSALILRDQANEHMKGELLERRAIAKKELQELSKMAKARTHAPWAGPTLEQTYKLRAMQTMYATAKKDDARMQAAVDFDQLWSRPSLNTDSPAMAHSNTTSSPSQQAAQTHGNTEEPTSSPSPSPSSPPSPSSSSPAPLSSNVHRLTAPPTASSVMIAPSPSPSSTSPTPPTTQTRSTRSLGRSQLSPRIRSYAPGSSSSYRSSSHRLSPACNTNRNPSPPQEHRATEADCSTPAKTRLVRSAPAYYKALLELDEALNITHPHYFSATLTQPPVRTDWRFGRSGRSQTEARVATASRLWDRHMGTSRSAPPLRGALVGKSGDGDDGAGGRDVGENGSHQIGTRNRRLGSQGRGTRSRAAWEPLHGSVAEQLYPQVRSLLLSLSPFFFLLLWVTP